MRWLKSATVMFGSIATTASGLAAGGFMPELSAAVAAIAAGLAVVLRFRPSAGKSITDVQAGTPN